MLVLTRRPDVPEENAVRLVLPDGTVLRMLVLEIDRRKVRIGFSCPADVLILRDELPDRPKAAPVA